MQLINVERLQIQKEEKRDMLELAFGLDGTDCQILLVTGPSKSFMLKLHYLCCKSLHSLPKFVSKMQRIQVGNGQFVSVLFIIPVIVDTRGHRFEVYTLVSEIHVYIDLVLGIKNIFELEGVINS